MRIFKQLCLLASLLLTLAFTSTTANAQWSDTENFEQNLGIWNDGGGDAYRSTAQVGLNGAYCMRLRDNSGSASSIFTDNINLSSFSVVVVNFIYIAESMESGEDFFFEYSNDGGSTFEKIKTYTVGSEFQNGQMEHETLTITRNFASNSVFRIRCDASGNQDLVYVDDIQMTASNGGGAACSVTATTSNIQCYGNGTSTIDDDTFTVDVTVTGSNTSGRWIGGIDGQEKSGNIGQTVTFGPYRTNHGSTISGWFRDQSNSNCQMDITVTAPRGCSDADNDPDPIPTGCSGNITGISINNNGTLINNINGQTFCTTDFAARDISVRSTQTGAHESLRFTITRPDGTQTNNENVLPYDSKGFWATRAGTYRVVAQLYSEDNQRGELCDTYTATFTVRDCGPSVDCANLNANIGDSCNDGNNNTENDVVNGNCQCVGTPILVACTPSIVVRNNGSCAISLFDWRTNGDVFIATIQPNNQRTVSFAEGTRLRAVDTGANFNNLAFDESYIVNANCNQTFTVNPTYCNQPVGCTGKITSFSINPQNAALIGNINGREFCTDQFAARDIRIRANVSGTHQSMRFTVTTPDGSWTTNENAETYDSKGFWATSPGTYTISAVLYSEDGQRGDQCDTRTETFTIIDCNGGNTGGGACDFQLVSYDGFEGGMDEWNDGGSDCARVEEDAAAAGRYCVRLRDNSGNASSMISDELNFGGVQQVKVEFTFFASSMENGEDFFLEYTTDGTNYKTVESWVSGTDFQNDRFDDVSITFDGDFTDWTKLRIRCDASGNKDLVFIDEVRVFACGGSYLTSGNTTNRTQTGTKAVETSEKVEVEVATEISVFPNPARDLLNIQGLNGQSYDVFNITGQRVIESSNQEVLDIMPLQNGTYILRTTEGQMIRFNKI